MGRRIRIWKETGMYHVTYECIARMFLLKPDPEVNRIIGYSLGRALKEAPIKLHSAASNINHLCIVFSIGEGQVENASSFLKFFAKLVATGLNRYYQLDGHFWAGRARVEEIKSDNQAERVLGYDACNAVKDGLVDSYRHWKGFSTTAAIAHGRRLRFRYTNRTTWWAKGGAYRNVPKTDFKEVTEVDIAPLDAWRGLKKSQIQTRCRHILQDRDELSRMERKATGHRAMGKERIAKLSPFAKPRNPRKKSPHPLCHADSYAEYKEYEEEYKCIANAYKEASAMYRSGIHDTEFPPGTFRPPLVAVYIAQGHRYQSQSP